MLTAFFHFSGSHFFRENHWPLVEAIPLMETTPSDRWHFLYWKLFLLLKVIPFSFLRKAFVFGGNHCPKLKPIFLEETYSF